MIYSLCPPRHQDDEKFLTEFFSLLSDEKTPILKRRDLVLFLKEFCTFSHTLQPQNKETFFKVRRAGRDVAQDSCWKWTGIGMAWD